MENYAGFLEHTDVILYIFSDKAPSAEGVHGSISDLLSQNAMPSTFEQQIEVLNKDYGGMDALGVPTLEVTYYRSWTYAGSAPFQGRKTTCLLYERNAYTINGFLAEEDQA